MSITISNGPKGHWLFGAMNVINNDIFNYMEEVVTYGDLVKQRFGPFPVLIVNHPDGLREVLVTKASQFDKPVSLKTVLKDVAGQNVFTADGDFWRKQRKLMQPAFHSQRIGEYADTMVDYAHRNLANWTDQQEVDVELFNTTLTMQIITKTMFDANIDDESQEIGEIFVDLFKVINRRLQMLFPIPSWIPTHDNRVVHQGAARVKGLLKAIIDQRQGDTIDHGDLLSMLMMAEDDNGQRMSTEQILNELVVIFGAGHETTAQALTWTFWAISQHPHVEQKLVDEVDSVLGNRRATLADLPDLPYTEQVIKETLRLYPPAYVSTRQANTDTDILGHAVKKNTTVLLPFWGIHRSARWFDKPLTYNPDRFSPEGEAQMHKYAFTPFGAGPRICIGNSFAMMEARLILATVMQHYRLVPVDGMIVEPMRNFTLTPRYGLRMIAHKRQTQPAVTAASMTI